MQVNISDSSKTLTNIIHVIYYISGFFVFLDILDLGTEWYLH
jgi:hypothetical protein